MGADLILGLLEIDHDKEPNWAAAQDWINSLSDQDCVDTVMDVDGCDDISMLFGYAGNLENQIECARDRIQQSLIAVREGWNGNMRCITRVKGYRTTLLIAADSSWGDEVVEVTHLSYFDASGCAAAAGFLQP